MLGLTMIGCPADDTDDDTGATLPTATDSGTDAGTGDADTDAGTDADTGGADTTSGGGTDLSHEVDMQPIWTETCVDGCHEPGGDWSFVDLSEGSAYSVLVEGDGTPTQTGAAGMPLVTPGNKEMSYVWHKINGTQQDVAGEAGLLSMPLNDDLTEAPLLDQATRDLIGEWIDGGAPE